MTGRDTLAKRLIPSHRTAFIDAADRHHDYHALCAGIADWAERLRDLTGGETAFVHVEAVNRPETLFAYGAALAAGYPVLLTGAGAAGAIVETFQPDVVLPAHAASWDLRGDAGSPDSFHPDLAVLLSTSGSTGSPKLVRLSHRNILANALSIADYLNLGQEDRAITNLPLHYSYGLSILNSHWAAGGSIVLHEGSVAAREFMARVETHGVTGLGGVPYTYELLEQAGMRGRAPPPGLRAMTQAGGRLEPALVSDFARYSRANEIDFFVMYGQTEATARMAYLPPALTLEHSDAIGIAIPGGRFEVRGEDGNSAPEGESGELFYAGPNVMMGYAERREELALGPGPDILATGDLAVEEGGLFRIVGRKSRFVKIAGQRIAFGDLERLLSEAGIAAVVTGDDSVVAIAITDGSDPARVREMVAENCRLPVSMIAAAQIAELPRLSSGKVDYTGLRDFVGTNGRPDAAASDTVAGVFAAALGRGRVLPGDSFASLGGDSLSYISAGTGIERLVGDLPDGWEHMTIVELTALQDALPTGPRSAGRKFAIDIPVRIWALLLVIMGHAAPYHSEFLRGGSSILFALGGYSLARFQRQWLLDGRGWDAVKGIALRMVLPYYLLMIPMLVLAKGIDRGPGWFFLVSTYTIDDRGPLFAFWFIESIFHALLIMVALSMIPQLRRFASRRPVGSGFALIGLAIALFVAVPLVWTDPHENPLTVDAWFYAYAVGWTLFLVRDSGLKLLVIAIGAAMAWLDYGFGSSRPIWLLLALLALAFLPAIRLPRTLGAVFGTISGAAYFIYLTHVLVVHVVRFMWAPGFSDLEMMALVVSTAMATGVAGHWVWSRLLGAVGALRQSAAARPEPESP